MKDLRVMHVLEEIVKDENLFDESESKAYNETDEYSDEDEQANNDDEVEIFKTPSAKDDEEKSESLEKEDSEYWVHEKTLMETGKNEQCHIHKFDDGFICRRYNLNKFPKAERNRLLEDNVLDVTKNFNHRVSSFRKNILMAPQSPLMVQYYQDRTEFQARGHGHIHGCAWSNFEELEKIHSGLKLTFLKLKQNKVLTNLDKICLIKFINRTVTCTLSAEKIELFGLSRKRAKKILKMVKKVNIHNHTKSCKKYSDECRFIFPRFPCRYTIIAQKHPEEMSDEEKASFWINIDMFLQAMKDALVSLVEFDMELEDLLSNVFSDFKIENEDGHKTIVVSIGNKKAIFSYNDVIDTASFLSGTEQCEEDKLSEHLMSAVYHYCLTFCRYGTRVILQRDVCEIFVNNYNPHWMEAWNGNMDLQICLDYFSIITYMTDYVTKPETKTTEALKQVKKIKEQEKASLKDLMQALIHTYLTHR